MREVRRFVRRKPRYIRWLQSFLPPTAFQWVRYLALHGGLLPLRHPRTFTQRLFLKMARDRNPLLTRTADKAELRGYVQEVLGEGHLTELYALLDHPDQLLHAQLPARYVVKTTHASGQNEFITADNPAVRAELVAKARGWWSRRHGYRHGEWAYEGIRPRLIVEEYLDGGASPVPPDWKWFCFHGRAGLVTLDLGRYRQRARNLYTPDGEWLDATLHHPRGQAVTPPTTFARMRQVAERLSTPFDFVRVDLYDIAGRIVVGELTHYPSAGTQQFQPASLDIGLGHLWEAASRPANGVSPTILAGTTALHS